MALRGKPNEIMSDNAPHFKVTKNILQRSICHLFPLECNMSDAQDEKINECAQPRNTDNANETQRKVKRLKRKTAMEARDKIYAQHLTKE